MQVRLDVVKVSQDTKLVGVVGDKAAPGVRRDVPASMLERMTLIFDTFDRRAARLNIEQVATRTGLPRSTVHRILDQLVTLQWLDHGKHGYSLGRRALGLGGHGGMRDEIRRAAASHLHELQRRTGMVVNLSVLDESAELVLDRLGGRPGAAPPFRVGGRSPAHTTTGGRAMLAWLGPEHVDALVRDAPLHEFSRDQTISGLHLELNRIRRNRGLAIDRAGVMSRNLTGVAMAVRGPAGPVAAICLRPEPRSAPLEHVTPLLIETLRRITADLFHRR
ncbi:IclR family transcriptional regulator [Rhodococcus sp. NPDC127528]|uniref:IclR family transcriptional regulator n=1 Tax=unclassified Rhodococcus (in: high G+C Gram-positive bacteria) TaxID=192944 RepID=UPI00363541D5